MKSVTSIATISCPKSIAHKSRLFLFSTCLIICLSTSSCKKALVLPTDGLSEQQLGEPNASGDGEINIVCIFSYEDLIKQIFVNPVRIKRVVLHDGTWINLGRNIVDMSYQAMDVDEANSVFRSVLRVRYNLFGYTQENTTNCWSLGCVYEQAPRQRYTVIVKSGKLIMINTVFVWGVPGNIGKVIKSLVID